MYWGNSDSGKILLVESRILGLRIWNTAQGTWNPTDQWNLESKFWIHYLESGIHAVESGIQDCFGFPLNGSTLYRLDVFVAEVFRQISGVVTVSRNPFWTLPISLFLYSPVKFTLWLYFSLLFFRLLASSLLFLTWRLWHSFVFWR